MELAVPLREILILVFHTGTAIAGNSAPNANITASSADPAVMSADVTTSSAIV